MGREVRMVPAGFEHPKDIADHFIPLLDDFAAAMREYYDQQEAYDHADAGEMECPYEPDAGEYMPEFPDGTATHYMMYETCSEGTPISPAFATPEELARWLAANGASAFGEITATYEEWLATIKAGSCFCSMMIDDGKIISGPAVMKIVENNKCIEALRNMLGCFDTPHVRLLLKGVWNDDFHSEVCRSARRALGEEV